MNDDRKPCVLCDLKTNKNLLNTEIALCSPCQGKIGNSEKQKEYLINSIKVSKSVRDKLKFTDIHIVVDDSEDENEEEDATDIKGNMTFGNKASAITFICTLMNQFDINTSEIEEGMF